MQIAGQDVYDATQPLMINITKQDIINGKGKDPGACAAAMAAMRSLGATKARVHLSRTYIELDPSAMGIKSRKSKVWMRYQTPISLAKEMIALDRGGKFEPGAHRLGAPHKFHKLKPPKPAIQLGKRKKRNDKPTKTHPQRGNRALYHRTANVRARGANI